MEFSPKNSIKRKENEVIWISLLKKDYSLYIEMSTGTEDYHLKGRMEGGFSKITITGRSPQPPNVQPIKNIILRVTSLQFGMMLRVNDYGKKCA